MHFLQFLSVLDVLVLELVELAPLFLQLPEHLVVQVVDDSMLGSELSDLHALIPCKGSFHLVLLELSGRLRLLSEVVVQLLSLLLLFNFLSELVFKHLLAGSFCFNLDIQMLVLHFKHCNF